MSTAAPPGPGATEEPEVLSTGMEPLSARSKRLAIIALVVAAVVLAGFAAWKLWPRPKPPFSLDDLRDVYAGMVRSDGTNDASVLFKENFTMATASVDPAGCEPLFEETTFSGFPDTALDGVGTYWPAQQMAVSLFTFRFADRAAAEQQFERVQVAVTGCSGRKITVAPRPLSEPPTGIPLTQSGSLTGTAPAPLPDVTQQTGYLFTTDRGLKFGVQVFVYDNLVSWQFRYDPATGPYDASQADQLSVSLAERIRFIDGQRS